MKKLFTLFCLLTYSFIDYGQSTYFSQDFLANTTIGSYANIPASANQFTEIPTVTGITNTITNGRYQIAKSGTTAVNYRFGRGGDFASEPKSMYCQFNFGVATAAAVTKNNAIVLSLGGSGIVDGVTVPTAANTYAKLNFNLIAGGLTFQLNDGTTNSANFTGNQDITFVMNNTGATFTYVAPDGTNETLGNDLFDVWVGTTKVFNDRPVTTATQAIKRFRFDITHDAAVANAPTVSFDNFLMRDVTGSLAVNTTVATADSMLVKYTGTGAVKNVGLGTTTPNAKLEINPTTVNTSGVRLTQLKSTSPAVASNGKVLSVNATGDIVLVKDSLGAGGGFTLPPLTSGSVLFSNGTTISQNNSKLFWDNTNFRLGVGTVTPAQSLDVVGGAKISGLAGTGNRMVVTDATGNLTSQAIPATTVADNLGNHTATQNIALNGFALTNNGTGGGITVNNTGGVGIGTTTPQTKLDVRGSIIAANTDYANGTTGSFLQIQQGAATGNTYSEIGAYSNGGTVLNNLVLNRAGGNVGIGTATPTSKLDVIGSFNLNGVLKNNDYGIELPGASSGLWFYGDRSYGLFLDKATNKTVYRVNNNDNAFVIANNSNLGIGTATPANKLEINGTGSGLRFTNLKSTSSVVPSNTGKVLSVDANGDVVLVKDSVGTVGAGATAWALSGNNISSTNSGNVGIGTTTPQYKLDVAGYTRIGLSTITNSVFDNNGLDIKYGAGNDSRLTLLANVNSLSTPPSGSGIPAIPNGTIGGSNSSGIRFNDNNAGTFAYISTKNKALILNGNGDGNVGIGTVDPTVKLDVNGTVQAKVLNIINDGTGANSITNYNNNGTNYALIGIAGAAGNLVTGSVLGDMIIRTQSKSIIFNVDGGSNAAMKIGSTGNVLIGASIDNGLGRLQVNGTTYSAKYQVGIDPTDLNRGVISFHSNNLKTTNQYFNGLYLDNNYGIFGLTSSGTLRLEFSDNANYPFAINSKSWNTTTNSYDYTERFRINGSNGNVGIGTITPTAKLDIEGALRVKGLIEMPTNSDFIWNAYYTSGIGWKYRTAGYAGGFYQDTNGGLAFNTAPNGSADAPLTFQRAFSVLNNGNFGIGTTTPTAKLEVAGTTVTSNLKLSGLTGGATNRPLFVNTLGEVIPGDAVVANPSANAWTVTGNNVSNTTLAGNVGIGTSTPTTKLTIQDLNPTLRLETTQSPTGYYTEMTSKYDGSQPFILKVGVDKLLGIKRLMYNNGNYISYVNGRYGIGFTTETGDPDSTNLKMFIASGGNVGVGTFKPSEKLEVAGNIFLNGNSPKLRFNESSVAAFNTGIFGTNLTNSRYSIYSLATNKEIFSVKYLDGNVGIGTETPAEKLEVAGNVRLNGNLLMNGSGDGTSFLSFFGNRNLSDLYFGGFDFNNNSGWTGWKGFHNYIQINDNGYFDIRKAANSTATSSKLFTIVANTGNVGIGTDIPTQKLDVNGTALLRNGNSSAGFTNDQILFGWNNTSSFKHSIKTRHHSGVALDNAIDFYTWKQGTDNGDAVGTQHVMTLNGQGNVGIGTTAPTHKLSVNGDALVGQESNGSGIIIRNNQAGVFKNDFLVVGKTDHTYLGNYQSLPIGIYTGNVERMRISADGNVTIGTTLTPAGYKLAIGGDVIAERVVVKLQASGWPDYVFTPTYHLSTLPEVEKFIEQNHHLPNVPSAKEVADKGIDVGAMNTKLMEKIEELTLYLIEQNKKLESIEKKNVELENAIKSIKK
jgi:hypothetical protein